MTNKTEMRMAMRRACPSVPGDLLDHALDAALSVAAPAEDVRAMVDEPVAFHMSNATAIEKLLKVAEVSRHVRDEHLGPMGATIVTEYSTSIGLRLVTEYSNGGCSAYLYPQRLNGVES